MTATITLDTAASEAAGNWQRFTCFCWFERPEDADQWAIFYTSNRDSGPLDRANAKVIGRELAPYIEAEDVREESHSHWAVGHVDGYAIRVFRDGVVTEAFTKWVELKDRMDDYPILDEWVHSEVEQEDIDQSWEAWAKSDFARGLEERFGRELKDDADLFELFHEQEPEWWEDGGGMTCNMERVIERVGEVDAEQYFVTA